MIYQQLCEACHAAGRTQEGLDTIREMESIFSGEIKLRRELHGWVDGEYLHHMELGQRLTRVPVVRFQVQVHGNVGKPRGLGDAEQGLLRCRFPILGSVGYQSNHTAGINLIRQTQ